MATELTAERGPQAGSVLRGRWVWRRRWACVVAGVAGVIVYANTLGNGFAYDDVAVVAKNDRITSLTNIRGIWLTDWWYKPPEQSEERHRDRLYRPLTMFTFALNYAISGRSPWSYHLFNVLTHAGVCVLAVLLSWRYFGRALLAWWTGLLFAVHPIHTEAVAGVVGRAEILAAGFTLACLLCAARDVESPGRGWWLWRAGLLSCFAGALLSKEPGIALLGLVPLTDAWLLRRQAERGAPCWRRAGQVGRAILQRRVAGVYLPMLAITAGYLALRYVALDYRLRRELLPSVVDNPLVEALPIERFWTVFKILGQYLWLMVWPEALCCDYSLNALPLAGGPQDPLAALGLAAAVVALTGAVVSASRRGHVALAVAFFVCCYLLVSNSVVLIGTIFGERLFYLPSLPVLWLLVMAGLEGNRRLRRAWATWRESRLLCPAVLVSLVAVLSARTILRNTDWKDSQRLFAADVLVHPTSARLLVFQARAMIKARQWDEAMATLRRALEIAPNYADAYRGLGFCLAARGEWDQARLYYETALQIRLEWPQCQREYEQWRRHFEENEAELEAEVARLEALCEGRPDDVGVLLELAAAQEAAGRYRDAIAACREVIARQPDNMRARMRLAALLVIDEQFDEAIEQYRRVLDREPDNWIAHTNLAMLLHTRDASAALEHARRAVALQPDLLETRMNLAMALKASGRLGEALHEFRWIRERLPAEHPAMRLLDYQIGRLERITAES